MDIVEDNDYGNRVTNTQFLLFDTRNLQYFLDEPPLTFVVSGLFVEGFVHILAGQAGVGKSVFALELARSIASGDPFLGVYDVDHPGPVIIVDSENPSSLIRDRIIKMQIFPTLPIYYLHFQDVKLNQPEWIQGLIDLIQYMKPRMVVFDSLARFHNLVENSVEGMAQISSALRQLSNQVIPDDGLGFSPALLVLHHANKAPTAGLISRGSGEIPAGCDIEYGMTRKGELREFQSFKNRIEVVDPFFLDIRSGENFLVIEPHASEDVLEDIEAIIREQPGPVTQAEIIKIIKERLGFGINKSLTYLRRGHQQERWNEEKGTSTGGRKPIIYSPNLLPKIHKKAPQKASKQGDFILR